MSITQAKSALDNLIKIARVHFYKPIQIAEILYHDRVHGDVNFEDFETYRNPSKGWRDAITIQYVGRSSSSSAEYQEALFTKAMPKEVLIALSEENREKGGIVEAYIYRRFSQRFSQMTEALQYCEEHQRDTFNIIDFINLFWHNPGLKRSIDKIYEITVYALFSILVEAMEVSVNVSVNEDKSHLLTEFEDFTTMVIGLSANQMSLNLPAKIFRVGVTNAADRGLDMYANFGMAIQIKHISLTSEVAGNIVGSVMADRIVIVCKAAEMALIVLILNQVGFMGRVQSVVTENDLERWYERALRGGFSAVLGDRILLTLREQIIAEFPATANVEFNQFYEGRGYNLITDDEWV